jgi:NADH:ubiquinone reductase (non-electrogenic)
VLSFTVSHIITYLWTTTDVLVTQKENHPGDQLDNDPSKPTLVVLGSGWGATSFLKNFDSDEYNVVVISPRNYFLFTPLLPSVTVGTLEPRSIIQPTRYITRHKKRKVAVYEAEAQEVDPAKKTVTFQGVFSVLHAHALTDEQIPPIFEVLLDL